MVSSAAGSVRNAIRCISAPHVGRASGKHSWMRAMRVAHRYAAGLREGSGVAAAGGGAVCAERSTAESGIVLDSTLVVISMPQGIGPVSIHARMAMR